MRRKLLLTTAALSVVLGAGGLAAAQDRSGDDSARHKQTIQQQDRNQHKLSNDTAPANSRQTTGQAPSSSQSQTQTTPADSTVQPQQNSAQPQQNLGQNNATGSSQTGTSQSGANQPAAGQSNQPSSAQTNPPAPTNQPSSAQTAPSNQTRQPSTATGSQTGRQPSTAQQQPSQGTVNANGQAQSATRLSASLQSSQKTRLNQVVAKLDVRPITNVNFSIAVGTAVPRTVTLHPVPAAIVEIIPQYRGYDFFVVRDEIVIVEPSSHTIVDVIERSGGSRAQATSSERKLNLSSQQKEVIRKHSQRRVTTTGSASRSQTKIIVGEEAPESVEIHTFPEEVYREVPAIRSYRYIEGDRSIYLVEPEGRRVIEDIE
ncbi:MAG: DUF1236 domain-containing protein [Rhizobiales bacterium]|nr:DUF1236 domain-containing protein [Hyphomicrobiales bacterium]